MTANSKKFCYLCRKSLSDNLRKEVVNLTDFKAKLGCKSCLRGRIRKVLSFSMLFAHAEASSISKQNKSLNEFSEDDSKAVWSFYFCLIFLEKRCLSIF